MKFSKTNEYTKTQVFHMTSQKSLTSLGNRLVIAGALVQHAIYCTGWNNTRGHYVALVLGNNKYIKVHNYYACGNTYHN